MKDTAKLVDGLKKLEAAVKALAPDAPGLTGAAAEHAGVRITDGRMRGTAYGTVILHVSPESSVGGNLALVQNGDMIELDVKNRTLNLEVSEEELKKRRASWTKPKPRAERGYVKMFIEHVEQADKGCDFDFLIGGSGDVVLRDLH
jgi:dihydroxy-acid dehydratase